MSNINIPAVASGAFLGFMALAALIWCFPPITRFLGDLCCCPWSIPFVRKRRRNGDEEMDKDDLLYVTDEPHAGTPVDTAGYQRVSAAYISVSPIGLFPAFSVSPQQEPQLTMYALNRPSVPSIPRPLQRKLGGVPSVTEEIIYHRETCTGEITHQSRDTMGEISMIIMFITKERTMGHTFKYRNQTWRILQTGDNLI